MTEPTGGSWLPLSVAVTDAGCRIGFVANRDSARLRKAISGANKTDLIDAAMLAQCERVLGVIDAPPVGFGQIGLRRALRRRHGAVVAAHRAECRLWALAAWAFPDVWRACGGHHVAQPVLRRWAHLGRRLVTRQRPSIGPGGRRARSGRPARRTREPVEDTGDVDDHRPVGVDGLEVGEAQVGLGLVGDLTPLGLLGVDGVLQVAGGGQDAGVDDEGVAVSLGGLVVMVG